MNWLKISFLLLVLVACSDKLKDHNPSEITIDLSNVREVKLSELVEEVRYVKLQTPDIPLGEGLIKIYDQYIYYLDIQQQLLCVFNHQGEFIARLDNQGNGPGEYLLALNFTLNEDESIMELWDTERASVIRYENLTFGFIDELKINNFVTFTSGLKLPNGDYLLSANQALNQVEGRITNAEFYRYGADGELKDILIDRVYKGADNQNQIRYSLFKFKLITDENKQIYASVNYDNKLYGYVENDFKPVAQVRFVGGESLDNERMLSMSKQEHLDYFIHSGEFVKTASFPNYEINNSTLMLVNYIYRENPDGLLKERNYIRLKKSGKNFHAKTVINDLTDFPKTIHLGHTNNDTYIHCNPWYKGHLISVASPEYLLTGDEEVSLPSVSVIRQDDNPVILLMKLRE